MGSVRALALKALLLQTLLRSAKVIVLEAIQLQTMPAFQGTILVIAAVAAAAVVVRAIATLL